MQQQASIVEDKKLCARQEPTDRRRNQWRTAYQSWFRRRRMGNRRLTDPTAGVYVDVHERWLVSLGLMAFLLSVTDACCTLALLKLGSQEMNPVMDFLIQQNVHLFLLAKFFITAAAVLFLVMHKNFRVFRVLTGYHLLIACFLFYSVLVSYELSMLLRMPLSYWFH